MKFTGLFTTAALFTGALAQLANSSVVTTGANAFNLTTINGTWTVQGVQSEVLSALNTLALIANVSISCPQVNITGDTNSTFFIQPSLRVNYFNSTSQQPGKVNISLGGLMSLNEVKSANEATFNVSLVLPQGIKELLTSADDILPDFTQDTLTVTNLTDPLPNGPDFTGLIDVKLASANGTHQDVILFKAYDFIPAGNDSTVTTTTNGPQKRDTTNDDNDDTEDFFYGLLVHETAAANGPLSPTVFNETVTAFGPDASDIAQFNFTCSA